MWRNWNPYARLVRLQNGAASMENCMEVLQNFENIITMWSSNPTSVYIPKRIDRRISIFIAHMNTRIHLSSHQGVETTQMFMDG